ncbi:pyruvate/2-oxoglutarate dehydrogenase complex dihydrolipoamide dehydrogenase (E3) component [Deinococcus metalli]|uniref:Mercuric reductase n=1 Tax=Deinococcus metalli TaxID=1141878 RepID=A0A7W8NQS0_9DEIO|nr:mercuric reductase [Deinococcus metalli]MBB5378171.1 pyruvate/2-oxoglutarate dehydrogenase complex dihydrolipoamide dehydrogenase (E3) component [Deinococcus metalli]GHF56566.1 mercuric reductase [Deinococcus metalli]
MPETVPSTAVVIGAGQAGGPLAGALARAGWHVTLIEREHVGGTCVNEGCTPTKTMIASARAAHLARSSADLGVMADVTVDLGRIVDRTQGIVRDFREGSEGGLRRAGVTLLRGDARFTGPRQVEVALDGGGTRALSADHVFINAGARPRWPDLPGVHDVGALTSKEVLLLRELPTHLLILGGGYISLEFAQLYARLGSRVTVVENGERLLPREDRDVVDALKTVLEGEGVDFRLGAGARRVARHGAEIVLDVSGPNGREASVTGSHLLVAVGRTPNTDTLNVEATGAALDRHGFIVVDEYLRAADGVYALGDIKGGPAFTHISYDDHRIVRDALLHGQQRSTKGRTVPYTLFTDPQLARVGLDRQQAAVLGRPTRIYTLPMTSVARAIETGQTAGLMRAVVDDASDLLLGVTVLGPDGGEIMSALQLALQGGLTATDLRNATFAHPTLCESINNLFMAAPESLTCTS